LRIFSIGAGYHRYFSHRSYSTSRWLQFMLAVLSQSSAQKSVLWWAAKHRHHHLHADTAQDVHSPRHEGFLYSHVGWIFARRNDGTDLARVADLSVYPELMWLHRHELVPAAVLAAACWLTAGWPGLVVGFFWSTVLVYHATFCINSLAHLRGRARYVTGDDSRNSLVLAVITMGEGWHNNHHAFQASARQGFRWWELDLTFYVLKLLAFAGLIWNLKAPPPALLRNQHRLGTRVIERAARRLVDTFDPDAVARAIRSALGPGLAALQQRLGASRLSNPDEWLEMRIPAVPTRDEILNRAMSMYAKTPSLDDIVDRAEVLLLESIGTRLAINAART
jgi:stearoyl-CoA desaturase (delta-9 desaturase)